VYDSLISGTDTLDVNALTLADKTNISLATSQTFNVTGNISGSVGSVTSAVTINSNSDITAIKGKTDNLPVDPASNTKVDTRMATFVYTAPNNADISAIKAIIDKVNSMLTADGINYKFTVESLVNVPTTDTASLESKVDTIQATVDDISNPIATGEVL
jgi:hypothetical protein